jgi:ribonuclease HII
MKRIANLYQERKLKKQGYKFIAGVDEVGCGAWAGPLFAGAIILSPKFKKKICDSKQLSCENREKYAREIQKKNKCHALGVVNKKELDILGLTKARKLACERAIKNLPKKPDFVLFDGYDIFKKFFLPYQFIVKGDEKTKSIACASIIVKVARDKAMQNLAKKYPKYQFEKNKGYGTKKHQTLLLKYGVCALHRKSFKPILKTQNLKLKVQTHNSKLKTA